MVLTETSILTSVNLEDDEPLAEQVDVLRGVEQEVVASAPVMRICKANTRILRANFRLKTDAMVVEFQLASPRTNGSPRTAENRTLSRARA